MCFVSFSLKETLYRKLNAIHNEETLTKTLEFYKHLGKGLGQIPPRGRDASRMPLPHYLCFASHSSLGSLTHTAFRVAWSRGRDLSVASAGQAQKAKSWSPTREGNRRQKRMYSAPLCSITHLAGEVKAYHE